MAVVLSLIYGQHVAERGDEHVDVADAAIAGLTSAGIFGTYIVVRISCFCCPTLHRLNL